MNLTLVRIQKNDHEIVGSDAKIHSSDEEEDEGDDDERAKRRAVKKERPLYLKDVNARHLIEEGPEFEDEPLKYDSEVYSEEQTEDEDDKLDKQDKYEAEYNFRFEEGDADRVLDHSRVVEGSERKKTNNRKFQRKSKEERMAQAEFERKEELNHLKNMKKKEIQERLESETIRATAGIGDGGSQEEGDLENPDFDKEDELLGLPKGWDGSGKGQRLVAEEEEHEFDSAISVASEF